MEHATLSSVVSEALSPPTSGASLHLKQEERGGRLSPTVLELPQPGQDHTAAPTSDLQELGGELERGMTVVEGALTLTHMHQVSAGEGLDGTVPGSLMVGQEETDPLALEDGSKLDEADQHKTLKLSAFPGQEGSGELELGGGGLPLEAPQYYPGLPSTPIMLYQVPAGGLVPFDSLVPLTKGLGGPPGEKGGEGVDLLGEGVFPGAGGELGQPLYVLHQPHKKEGAGREEEELVMEQLGAGGGQAGMGPDMVLEGRAGDQGSFPKDPTQGPGTMMPLATEFSLISTSCYDGCAASVGSITQVSTALCQASSSQDSEVALTLASLGNPKLEKLGGEGGGGELIRAASIISGVTQQQFEALQPAGPGEEAGLGSLKKEQKPTLVLRSRRGRGGVQQQQQEEVAEEEGKRPGRRRRRPPREPRLPAKQEEAGQGAEGFLVGEGVGSSSLQQKENLLGQLLKASEHCEPASLIPEGVVDDVIPAVGYRVLDMTNLTDMIRMMHRCSGALPAIVIQEQASLREGAVSQLSVICTGCQEGAVCATSNRISDAGPWDINARVEQLTKEFNIEEEQVQRMLEILGIFYRPCRPASQPPPPPMEIEMAAVQSSKKKRRKKCETDTSGKPKNLVCSVCKERFVGENHLKKHMLSHDLSLHTCPYCHAYFKKSFNLKQHIKKHENCKYECGHCQRTFTDKSTLHCHIRSQHEKRYNIQCEACPKRFYHRAHYNEHMRIHTGEKPYMCELCGKKFSWHDSVKKHMQTHSAESKYKCRLCGKWFRWLQGVRQHLQQQHKLKKCDVEAQVVTAAAAAPALLEFHPQQPQHNQVTQPQHNQVTHSQHSEVTQHSQVVQQQQQHPQVVPGQSPAEGSEGEACGRQYHTLEAATPQQQTLDMFQVGEVVEAQQQPPQDMFQYH